MIENFTYWALPKGTKAKDEPKDENENEAEHSLKKKRKVGTAHLNQLGSNQVEL